ncbi:MAG: hypothetical protein ACLP0L_15760 [Solirubrobacteraceae bacterium]
MSISFSLFAMELGAILKLVVELRRHLSDRIFVSAMSCRRAFRVIEMSP